MSQKWPSIQDRFSSGVELVPFSTCHYWIKSGTPKGYGVLSKNGKQGYAHRTAWELKNGEIPDGLFVCHTCDNPSCVNPDHLFLGTALDNATDMKNKGRANGGAPSGERNWIRRNPWAVRGENSGSSKIKALDVLEIRKLYAGGARQVDLAEKFSVNQSHISRIVRKESWSHE